MLKTAVEVFCYIKSMISKAARIFPLHPAALEVIERYCKLRIGGKQVTAPYFMNEPGRKARRVRVGKGTAAALERETLRLARKYNFDVTVATPEEIREFMIRHQLGIDCSGLVAWASHALVRQVAGRSLWRDIQFEGHPLRNILVRRLRPVENISARVLTDKRNALTISDLRKVQPGDIIRTLNGNHVLLITEIGYDGRDDPMYFRYINSTEYNGVKHGVRYGLITISKPGGHILQQKWLDGENGINWIFNAANDFPDDTRIVRLKSLDKGSKI